MYAIMLLVVDLMGEVVFVNGPRFGAVMIAVISATRILLVKDKSFTDPRWKLPGGSVEAEDTDITSAAIRELGSETGLRLKRWRFTILTDERRTEERYRPHLCVVRLTETKLDSHEPVGNEDGKQLEVRAFTHAEVLAMTGILTQHLDLIREALASS